MAQENKYLYRTNVFADWHRAESTKRFIGSAARYLYMHDLDCGAYIEWGGNQLPLFLIESAEDVGQEKKASFLKNLVKDRREDVPSIPVLVVLHKTSKTKKLPGNNLNNDIEEFRVKTIWPEEDKGWSVYSPEQWAKTTARLRDEQIEYWMGCGRIQQ